MHFVASSVSTILQKGVTLIPHNSLSNSFLIGASVSDYSSAYKTGLKTPTEVMKLASEKVLEWEAKGFPIFSSFNATDVLQQARESDARHASGKPLSILDGVPVAFKDVLDIVGHSSTNGKKRSASWLDGGVSTEEDTIIKRFRALGAIIFGLTIMTEGGTTPLGYNSHFRGPFNPYSKRHYSGGSSGGSAVAVATGLVPIAIGFDSGGSIRLPAAWSGIHGLATTVNICRFSLQVIISVIFLYAVRKNSP